MEVLTHNLEFFFVVIALAIALTGMLCLEELTRWVMDQSEQDEKRKKYMFPQ